MAFLDNFLNRKPSQNNQSKIPYKNMSFESYFGMNTELEEEEALKIPALAASLELITSSVAQLPIYLYKKDEKGEIIKVEDRRTFLLNREPNEVMNGNTLKRQIVKDYIFYGASYLKIEKFRNDVISIYNLPTKNVVVTQYIEKGYKHSAVFSLMNDETKSEYTPDDLVIILKDSNNGFTATGILKDNTDTLLLALDEQDYTMSILKNGALPIGVLKASSRLSADAIDRLRESWENLYGGSKKAGKTIVLEEGLDYNPISMKPNELDLTNVRKHTVSEISRILNVPESMINSDLTRYASNEQNNIYFLQYCLAPILTSIEAALNKSLLLESEKEENLFFKFDVTELLRTTEKEKIDTVTTAVKNGLLSINEGRARIDMPNIKDDYFILNLGSIFYNAETGDFTIPNLGRTIDPNEITEALTSGTLSDDKKINEET